MHVIDLIIPKIEEILEKIKENFIMCSTEKDNIEEDFVAQNKYYTEGGGK